MSTSAAPVDTADRLNDLDQFLIDNHLAGSWFRNVQRDTPLVKPEPKSGYAALHWGWTEMHRGLLEAGRLVPVGPPPGGLIEMRTVRGVGAAHQAINMNAQILMPGERTRAHHNMKNETRLVHEAPPGAVFVCDGEAFPMERGDVIVSPSWSDHDHYNAGDAPAIWIDGYDTGYSSLGADLNTRYPADAPYQEIGKPSNYGLNTLGRVQPFSRDHSPNMPRPAVRYPWSETAAAIDAMRAHNVAPDPYDGLSLMLTSTVDGGPTLPTIAWHVQVLPRSFVSGVHRHNSTTCYHAFSGEGTTTVEDERINWKTGDLFVVPPWTWHSHEIADNDDAVLFAIDDWPARTVLGFYAKEERSTH